MKLRPILFLVATLLTSSVPAQSLLSPAQVVLTDQSLTPGTQISLVGDWLFKPSYELAKDEHPESSANNATYRTTPVPQLLNRISWWLDDSEDFKKWEDARLKNLGFDTEKSDDGWYRMWIDAPALPKDRHVFVEFDGVAMRCETYLNGAKLGEHAGMFSRFSYDLTANLKPGKNLLSVHVSMEKIPSTTANLGQAVTVNLSAAKVVSMSKGMFGPLSPAKNNRAYDLYGIWQPAKLVVRGESKIDDVFFNPSLTGATVEVQTAATGTTFTAKLTDPATNQLLATTSGVTSPLKFESLQPKLWTPATPNLYRLDVTLQSPDGRVVDTWTHNVGFRTFEVKGNQLLLNGHPYFLRGANQLPYGKNPFSPDLAKKLIQSLHDNNIRFTRTHATPWNEAWLDAADEIGLAVSVEGIRPWAFAGKSDPPVMPPTDIFQHWLTENEDVVKRCRNHPSVFLLTVGNEMLLKDSKNLDKWKLLSQVVEQTRKLSPVPVICSSDYTRDPEFYESTLKPNHLDDGDIDDMHRYFGWYAESPFVQDMNFEKELASNKRTRPLIGQEFATGYPNLDDGLPVWRYTGALATPQAWVGRYAYPGADPMIFLTQHQLVTKRLAESLRAHRRDVTSGFALFSAECWFKHSYDPATFSPYPVLASAKEFWAPIGLSLDTNQRRFYAGEPLKTNVFLTNDDEQFRDLKDLTLTIQLLDSSNKPAATASVPVPSLAYYATATLPISLDLPQVEARTAYHLLTTLTSAGKELSRTTDPIELFPRLMTHGPVRAGGPVFLHPGSPLDDLAEGKPLRQQIEAGTTVVLLSPDKSLNSLFPDDILDVKKAIGEFADSSPVQGTPLGKDLHPMDIKWWARKDDWRAFVASQSHRIKPGSSARSLIDFIPTHSYISADKLAEQFRTVLFEIPLGKGRLWVCDLDLAASQGLDPIADIMMANLKQAAADPASTSNLPKLLTHAEIVQQVEKH